NERAAKRASEIVALELGEITGKIEWLRIESLIAVVFERRSVKSARTGFGHQIDLPAGAPVLRRKLRSLDLELRNRVAAGRVVQRVVIGIGIDGSVDEEQRAVRPATTDAESANLIQSTRRVLLHGPPTGVRARHQKGQLNELTAVEGQRLDLFLGNNSGVCG